MLLTLRIRELGKALKVADMATFGGNTFGDYFQAQQEQFWEYNL